MDAQRIDEIEARLKGAMVEINALRELVTFGALGSSSGGR